MNSAILDSWILFNFCYVLSHLPENLSLVLTAFSTKTCPYFLEIEPKYDYSKDFFSKIDGWSPLSGLTSGIGCYNKNLNELCKFLISGNEMECFNTVSQC